MFIEIGLDMGREVMNKYINGFGFGRKSGIDLAGEASGILLAQRQTRELDVATISIGQTNAVSPLQLLNAFGAIANGGNLMKPQIVKEIRDVDGNLLETVEPELIRKVISQSTSDSVMSVLETVVSAGTGRTAFIDGYRVGGKTGTAQKVVPGVGYSETEFILSFMGVAPVNDPQVVCLVVVDYPKGELMTGGAVCGPIFQAAMRDVLNYLQIPMQVEPQRVSAPSFEEITLQDYTGIPVAVAENRAAAQGVTVSVVGTGERVYAQLPLANTRMLRGGGIVLYTKIPPDTTGIQKVVVPELTGKTREEVLVVESDSNLRFELSGTGVVMYQQPSPGVMIELGSKIEVGLEEPLAFRGTGELAGP